jgi:hypothetical protein
MAGDWIKFEKATPDKPEVFQMAETLGIDPDAVIGKLLRVWNWFDEHSESGNANVTVRALLDRVTGVTGFSKEMENVGWLEINGDQMMIPNFERHNGATAKKRCSTNRRVAKSRSGNGKCNTQSVTDVTPEALQKALPEKRREEKSIKKEAIASCPLPDVLAEIWESSPKSCRERSSKKQVADEWKRIKVSDRPSAEDLNGAIAAWSSSEKWKEGFGEGLHLWIKRRQWENIPTPQPKTNPAYSGTREMTFGGRTGNVISAADIEKMTDEERERIFD